MDVCLYFSILGRLHLDLILDELYLTYGCMYSVLNLKICVITGEADIQSEIEITPEVSKVMNTESW